MAKKTNNKEFKPTKKDIKKEVNTIDWDSLPEMVTIICKGKEVLTHKSNAKVLVSVKRAELK